MHRAVGGEAIVLVFVPVAPPTSRGSGWIRCGCAGPGNFECFPRKEPRPPKASWSIRTPTRSRGPRRRHPGNAARPRAVSCSRFPVCSPIHPRVAAAARRRRRPRRREGSPRLTAPATAVSVAAVGRRVVSLQRNYPPAHSCRTACTLACDSCSVSRTISAASTPGDLNCPCPASLDGRHLPNH